MEEQDDHNARQREAEIITACAIRFNSHGYADQHGKIAGHSDYLRLIYEFVSNFLFSRGHNILVGRSPVL